MRLSNRTKTWAEAGRRLWGERKDHREDESDGKDFGAWDAAFGTSLAPSREEPVAKEAEPAPAVSPLLTGDPTQQLLTALGRFQRQVNVADSGAPPEAWVDNCIDQLIAGIQIAHVRGWKGVKEALTDTAQILQSYDEAGDAAGAVAFLHDGYEILCLMVGDLIVDNVRSGVMDKWRERYSRAVSDLHHAGYSLIDEESTGAPQGHAPSAAAAAARPTNVTPFMPRASATEDATDEAPGALSHSYFDEDEEASVEEMVEQEEELEEAAADEPFAFMDEAFDDDEAQEETVAVVDEVVVEEDAESEEVESLVEEEEEVEEEMVVEVLSSEEFTEEELEASADPSPFEEPFIVLEEEEEDDEETLIILSADEEEDEEEEAALPVEAEAAESLWVVPNVEEEAEEEVEEHEEDERAQQQETLFLFEEAVAEEEAEDESDDETAQWMEEGDEAEVEAVAVAETAPAKPAEDAPEALLRNAQAAMLRGDVRDAKVLALQLAVNMAKLEAQKAVQIVQDAVDKLVTTEAAIEVADGDVAKAQQRLAQMHEARTGREHDLDVKRSGIAGLEKRNGNVETAIAKLDEQIAKLQLQREEELAKLQEVQAELEAERNDERIVAEDLDRLHEAEQAAEDTLELARSRADELREQRLEREQAREACEQMLARQRESAEHICRTLEAVVGSKN